MKYDSSLNHSCVQHQQRPIYRRFRLRLLFNIGRFIAIQPWARCLWDFLCSCKAMSDVFDNESYEHSRHDDGRCGCFIVKSSKTFIVEVDLCVGEKLLGESVKFNRGNDGAYMNERGRNDDTRTNLTQTNENCMIHPHAGELGRENWAINANGTGD
jgi:hypothetical protein